MSYERLRREVIQKGLCVRCGLCVGICPVSVIDLTERLFPKLVGKCTNCEFCNNACPGSDLNLNALSKQVFNKPFDPHNLWGHQEKIFVGHSKDESIHRDGASGGLVTGILVYLLKTGRIDGAVVIGMDPDHPWETRSMLATTEAEIRSASQSKYCIVPSMDVLAKIRRKKGSFAVVGLPCQVHGLRKLEAVDPKLAKKISYIFGLYCHYNMETAGYIDALEVSGIRLNDLAKFQFRGGGWPGGFFVVKKNGEKKALHKMPYSSILNIMFRLYGAERCFLCIDPTAELADLSFGDFWANEYKDAFKDMTHCTMCSQRSEKGLSVLKAAQKDGAIRLYPMSEEKQPKRTLGFIKEKKTEGYIRLRRLKKKGRPVPDYHHEIPKAALDAHIAEAIRHRFTQLFRGSNIRKRVLNILFSPMGEFMDRVNRFRKL